MIALILSQLPITLDEIDKIAGQDFKWWFTAMFILGLFASIYIFRLQLNQNADQRKAHSDMTTQLITYITTDHAKALVTVENSSQIMSRTSQALERAVHVLESVTQL